MKEEIEEINYALEDIEAYIETYMERLHKLIALKEALIKKKEKLKSSEDEKR